MRKNGLTGLVKLAKPYNVNAVMVHSGRESFGKSYRFVEKAIEVQVVEVVSLLKYRGGTMTGARLSDYASLKAQGEYMGLNKCSNIYSTPDEKTRAYRGRTHGKPASLFKQG
jgi:hypothetical protein